MSYANPVLKCNVIFPQIADNRPPIRKSFILIFNGL